MPHMAVRTWEGCMRLSKCLCTYCDVERTLQLYHHDLTYNGRLCDACVVIPSWWAPVAYGCVPMEACCGQRLRVLTWNARCTRACVGLAASCGCVRVRHPLSPSGHAASMPPCPGVARCGYACVLSPRGIAATLPVCLGITPRVRLRAHTYENWGTLL